MNILPKFLSENKSFQSVFKNAGVLFSGSAISYAISFATVAVMTRALSIEMFGIYSLVISFIALMDRLTSFQTWQAMIHYGIKAKEKQDKPFLFSLLLFGFFLDILSGIAGAGISILLATFVPKVFGIETAPFSAILLASCVLCFNWFSSCTALFRIFGHYKIQAHYQILIALTGLLGSILLWQFGVIDLGPYILVWAISNIIGRFYFCFAAISELRRNDLLDLHLLNFEEMKQKADGIWKFVFTTNMDGIIRVLRDLDVFIINGILGPSAVGYYKIARLFTKFVGKLIDPFYQTVYPELMQLLEKGETERFKTLIRHSSLTIGGGVFVIFLGFALVGYWFLPLAFGSGYEAAYGVTLLCLASCVVWGFVQPLSPALISMGMVKTNLIVHTLTTACYLLMLFGFSHFIGLEGAGLALFLFYLLWGCVIYLCLVRSRIFRHDHR